MNQKEWIASKLAHVINHFNQAEIIALLEKPKSSDLGDLAFPTFALAKVERKAPPVIATEIVEKIDTTGLETVRAVGPYVNFFLDKATVFQEVVTEIVEKGTQYGYENIGQGETIAFDMSSPNIAKPFSIGHLRSTVIADALANIVEKLGYKPIRINHLGDWGKQFGLLIVAYKLWGDKEAVETNPINELLKLYVRINEELEEHPEYDAQAREWFRRLEAGDVEATELWQWFRDESLVEFNRLYKQLNVRFDSYNGEAFYNDKMDKPIQLLEDKGLLQESQGAMIVHLDKYDLSPALIKKSDGATLYITRDLAAAMYRKNEYQFAKSVYVVGNEQASHFKQLKAVLTEMGMEWADDIVHVPFGLVTKNGKKLSTRKGNVILLEPTIAEAIHRALMQIEAKHPNLPDKEAVAHAVGVGAIKFYDLKTDRLNGYDFDLEAMVSFEGETGPYIQYTHARIQSLLKKASFDPLTTINLPLTDTESWEIIKLLQDFTPTIKRAAKLFEPSILAKYAIHLAQSFNKYYAHTRILDENPERDSRLALVYSTGLILKETLRLLGIEAPDTM